MPLAELVAIAEGHAPERPPVRRMRRSRDLDRGELRTKAGTGQRIGQRAEQQLVDRYPRGSSARCDHCGTKITVGITSQLRSEPRDAGVHVLRPNPQDPPGSRDQLDLTHPPFPGQHLAPAASDPAAAGSPRHRRGRGPRQVRGDVRGLPRPLHRRRTHPAVGTLLGSPRLPGLRAQPGTHRRRGHLPRAQTDDLAPRRVPRQRTQPDLTQLSPGCVDSSDREAQRDAPSRGASVLSGRMPGWLTSSSTTRS